jgi:hypothetical protein
MNSQTENVNVDLLEYLPKLKRKFIDFVEKNNEMEQIFIDAAFENYELYLGFRQNNNTISVESTQKLKRLGENDHIQMASMILYYKKITDNCKQGNFIEADAKLLKEIFKFYRESMLHFKCQKVAFKTIKASLNNLLKL